MTELLEAWEASGHKQTDLSPSSLILSISPVAGADEGDWDFGDMSVCLSTALEWRHMVLYRN